MFSGQYGPRPSSPVQFPYYTCSFRKLRRAIIKLNNNKKFSNSPSHYLLLIQICMADLPVTCQRTTSGSDFDANNVMQGFHRLLGLESHGVQIDREFISSLASYCC